MKKTITLLFVSIIFVHSHAQIIWDNIYGTGDETRGNQVIETPDGGYIACGTTDNPNESPRDMYIFKTDEMGGLIWEKYYGGYHLDEATDINVLDDTSFLVIGTSLSLSGGYSSAYYMCINQNGDSVWAGNITKDGTDLHIDCMTALDNNQYLFGGYISTSFGNKAYLLKINTLTHDTLWSQVIDPNDNRYPITSIIVHDDKYYMSATNGILITDSFGNLIEIKNIDSHDLMQATDSSYFSIGEQLHEISFNGDILRTFEYDGHALSEAKPYRLAAIGSYDIMVFDSLMEVVSINPETAKTDLISTSDSAILLVGAKSNNSNQSSMNLKKIDIVDIITGSIQKETDKKSNIYPNPGRDKIYISHSLNEADLSIFDSMGRLVLSRKNVKSNSAIQTSALDSGLYFYSILKSGKVIESGKWIKN